MTIRVAVVGACGRMGSEVARMVALQPDMKVTAAVEARDHPRVGSSIAGAVVTSEMGPALASCDVTVDFSVKEAVRTNVMAAAAAGRPFVCGVTDLTDETMESLRQAAKLIPVVYSVNFSVGIALLARLTAEAARLLDEGFDVEIIEVHHRTKKDAPSGTAKMLFGAIKEGRKTARATSERQRTVGAKPAGEVGISSVRVGDVVGEHTVVFGGAGERLELTHRVQSRIAFAAGVVSAIRFVKVREPGWFSLIDVFNSSS
ncbi:MAG: 4-hydroxy-tetrahydrodipicolinate reductase [candidate division WOR-3 bacterium]